MRPVSSDRSWAQRAMLGMQGSRLAVSAKRRWTFCVAGAFSRTALMRGSKDTWCWKTPSRPPRTSRSAFQARLLTCMAHTLLRRNRSTFTEPCASMRGFPRHRREWSHFCLYCRATIEEQGVGEIVPIEIGRNLQPPSYGLDLAP